MLGCSRQRTWSLGWQLMIFSINLRIPLAIEKLFFYHQDGVMCLSTILNRCPFILVFSEYSFPFYPITLKIFHSRTGTSVKSFRKHKSIIYPGHKKDTVFTKSTRDFPPLEYGEIMYNFFLIQSFNTYYLPLPASHTPFFQSSCQQQTRVKQTNKQTKNSQCSRCQLSFRGVASYMIYCEDLSLSLGDSL